MHVPVRFVKSFAQYNAGETASWLPERAKALVDGGAAVFVVEEPKVEEPKVEEPAPKRRRKKDKQWPEQSQPEQLF